MDLSPSDALALIEYVLAARSGYEYVVGDEEEVYGTPLWRRLLDAAAGQRFREPWAALDHLPPLEVVPSAVEWARLAAEDARLAAEERQKWQAEQAERDRQERARRAALTPEQREAEDWERGAFRRAVCASAAAATGRAKALSAAARASAGRKRKRKGGA